jgi:hypothetical protein
MTTRCSGLARAMAGSAVGSGWAPSMALCRAFSQAGANMPGLGGAAGATWVSAAALRARALEEPEPMVWVWPMPVPAGQGGYLPGGGARARRAMPAE